MRVEEFFIQRAAPIFYFIFVDHRFELFELGWRFPTRLVFPHPFPFDFKVRLASDEFLANNFLGPAMLHQYLKYFNHSNLYLYSNIEGIPI